MSEVTRVTERPANVRIATRADEMRLFEFLKDLHRNNKSGWGFALDPELVMIVIECGTRPNPEDRTDPKNERRGVIGLIEEPDGEIVGSVGIFLDPPMWFSKVLVPLEHWLYVRPGARNSRRLERDLARFAEWVHERLRPVDYDAPFPLLTGFLHRGSHFPGLSRLWQGMFKDAKPFGLLFWRD